jgi:Zn-dependent peptidase ImmA (M78 family)/transcriptional regulator with XRE-family HTH domain
LNSNVLHTIDPALIGERLAEARRSRRLTQQNVADVLDVARTTVVAIEKGERRPRATELVKLAALFGRSASEFLKAAPPGGEPDFLVQFRQARKPPTDADQGREEDIRTLERLCRWYVELETLNGVESERRYPEPYDISGTPPERAAQEVATAERNRLGLGDGPIGDLWQLLDGDVGLRVFAFPMQDRRTAGMFLCSDAYGGCIAVNATHPEDRQRWSAAHEFGHFVTRRFQPEVTVLSPTKRVREGDRFADAFARNFLMPAVGLSRRFDAIRRAKGTPFTPGELLQLASIFGVSAQAMTWRLEDLRLLPVGTWDLLRESGFQPDAARSVAELPLPVTGASQLPKRYELLAVQAFLAADLSEGQLAERLMTDRVGARELVESLLTVEQPAENGSWTQVQLDISRPIAASS